MLRKFIKKILVFCCAVSVVCFFNSSTAIAQNNDQRNNIPPTNPGEIIDQYTHTMPLYGLSCTDAISNLDKLIREILTDNELEKYIESTPQESTHEDCELVWHYRSIVYKSALTERSRY